MMECFYRVAEHVFAVSAQADVGDKIFAECMDNYKPFAIEKTDDCLFVLNVECGEAPEYTKREKRRSDTRRHGRWHSKGNGRRNQGKPRNKTKKQ